MTSRSGILLMLFAFAVQGCSPMVARFMAKSFEQVGRPILPADAQPESPMVPNARLAVLWIGHATVLVQVDDKLVMTDPLFTNTAGMIMKRTTAPGLNPALLPSLDFTIISHTHFDHFSYGSLDQLPKNGSLLIPYGSLAYTPDLGFREIRELQPWESVERDGLKITAVPVQHFSGRYGFDILWMKDRGYTGYVIEKDGVTVYFGGDTGYHPELFAEVGRRFSIDLAILPIGPIEPRDFMERNHVDPAQALRIFNDLKATLMLPMHHRTLVQGFDPSPGFALQQLLALAERDSLTHRIIALDIGEQRMLLGPGQPRLTLP